MSQSHDERLYELLPSIYRVQDAAQGESLRALLAIVEGEMQTVEADIEGLYENWFIETCDEWAIPYIADLLGVRPLHHVESAGAYSLRAYVANTLRYRRRKGTAPVLEQLARDVTGWPARAVEFFQLLSTTQYANHIRLHSLRTPDLRDATQLELVDTPFDSAAHTVEVRNIASRRGKYNIANVGLFLWRIQPYAVMRGAARPVIALPGSPDGRYYFNPLRLDIPLFNRPQTETEITQLAQEINVPGELRRRALYDDLEAYRRALVGGETPHSDYFGVQPVLSVYLNEQFIGDEPVSVPVEEILVCDLSDWQRPAATKTYSRTQLQPDGTPITEDVELPITVAVDPELGRLTIPTGDEEPTSVHVSYAYGFSADVGGGPYSRQDSLAEITEEIVVDWQVGVAQSPEVSAVGDEQIFTSLADAVQAWNAQPPGTVGAITIMDSYTYHENLIGAQAIIIPSESKLLLVAADWPKTLASGSISEEERRPNSFMPTGLRPHIVGTISVRGTAPFEDAGAGALIVDGLLLEGELRVLVGNLGGLELRHSTIDPISGSFVVHPSVMEGQQNDRLEVKIIRSITGGMSLPATVPELTICDSIVDHPGELAIAAAGAAATIDNSTIIGRTRIRSLEASETIFRERVQAQRQQVGCVRFSSLAEGSQTPRRFRCQPDLALEGVEDETELARLRRRLTPVFTSDDFGDPFYMQLSRTCAKEILTGADDGSEMGVLNHLKQAQRTANLQAALDEYLPFGLQAGIFYVT